ALRSYVRWCDRERENLAAVETNVSTALRAARDCMGWESGRVLPEIPVENRVVVRNAIIRFEDRGEEILSAAIECLSRVRKRLNASHGRLLFAGIRKRFDLVREHLMNDSLSEPERMLAAAAVLYLDEVDDAIPDAYGLIGLLDDDFALQYVLHERFGLPESEIVHWAERICSLWDDLPFLQGLHLVRNGVSVAVTWLDRVIAFTAYEHVLASSRPLILAAPQRAFQPIETIVVLLGLLLFEHLTIEPPKRTFVPNRLYCIDGKFY